MQLYILEFRPSVGNLLTTLDTYGPEYEVSFEINPTGTVSGWANIIDIRVGTNSLYLPTMWLHSKSTRLHVYGTYDGSSGHIYDSKSLPSNTWSSIIFAHHKQPNGEYHIDAVFWTDGTFVLGLVFVLITNN